MPTRFEQHVEYRKSVSLKAAYSRTAHRKLSETKARLAGVSAKINNAVRAGRIEGSEQLERAQHAVDANIANVEARLEQLRKSSDCNWEELRADVDTAWEDLSQSVKKLVARFSDDSDR